MHLTLPTTRRTRERGAVAVITALFMSTVVIAMLALSVDMGGIVFERRQLQNGTDAAAMALAQTCILDGSACNATNTSTLTKLNTLASANAIDNLSQLNSAFGTNGMCARDSNPSLGLSGMPACASATSNASIGNLAQCPPLPTAYLNGDGAKLAYVETYVQTKSTASDNTILPSIFAKSLTGSDGVRQTACARVVWGPGAPSSKKVISMTISECDWVAATGGPSVQTYPPAPLGAWPGYSDTDDRPDWPTTAERAVWSKGNPTTGCDTSSPGGTAPGGFAWLTGQACQSASTEGWIKTDPGANQECTQDELMALRGTLVYIPVFDCMAKEIKSPIPSASTDANYCKTASGSNTYYHISGFAPFYLTGWFLGNSDDKKKDSIRPAAGRYLCTGDDRCLFGWFTRGVIPEGDFVMSTPADPNYGITIMKPAG